MLWSVLVLFGREVCAILLLIKESKEDKWCLPSKYDQCIYGSSEKQRLQA